MWKSQSFLLVVIAFVVIRTPAQAEDGNASGDAARPTAAQLAFFETEVRPVLATHCYECHSANAKRLEAGLRLDSRRGMLRGGDSGPVIEPGNVDESMLIEAVRYEGYEMPPSGKLPDKAVAALEKWVSMGAPWPDEPEPEAGAEPPAFNWKDRKEQHWCWQPIRAEQPPAVAATDWPINAIDDFILATLEEKELVPAEDADRRTLARRVFYDLIGLPPTVEQLNAFLKDESEYAFESLVDELLESPHFGEKWARHWLDLVRYGETLGHEFDYPLHHAHRYRDYVIRAFNADVPYDQFVHEHVAGDLLDQPRLHPDEQSNESILGTGFWYLGEACHAPTDVRQDEADRVDNQIDVFSKTFLGLTVACARCHDHKFDPIPTKDYYALYGYIQSSRRQEAMLDPHQRIQNARQRLQQLNAERSDVWQQALPGISVETAKLRESIEKVLASEDKATVEALQRSTHPLHALAKLKDAQDIAGDAVQLLETLEQEATSAAERTAATESLIDFATEDLSKWYYTGEAFSNSVTQFGDLQSIDETKPFARTGAAHSGLSGTRLQGVLRSPTFVIPARQLHYRLNARNARIRLIIDGYTMDEFNALLFNDVQKKNINTQGQTRWITQARDLYHYVGHRAHIEILDDGDGFAAVEEIRFSDSGSPALPPHSLNHAVLGTKPTSLDELWQAYTKSIQTVVASFRDGEATNDEIDLVNWLVANNVIESPQRAVALATEMTQLNDDLPAPVRAIALQDGDAEEEYVFIRGNHQNRGEVAPRRLLVAIGGEDQTPDPQHSGRLQLAQSLTHPSNPLTSRVIVNRLWHHLFGRGIVPTVDDFGKMGQLPSHPELLDWLAHDFTTRKGWSIKRAIRQMVLSRTYRQSAQPTANPDLIRNVDPENVFLHRAPVRRLTGEAIRDTLLQLSGRLDRTMYGPSVTLHLTSFMEGRGRPRKSGPLDGDGRRSLYIEVRRNFLSPMMLTFDRPSPFSTMGRRANSNVPAQSLMLMNDPFVVEQANGWAKRILQQEDSGDARIRLAFEMAFARPPSPAQLQRCREFVGDSDDEQVWGDLCHMLINLKPFIFIN